MATALCIDCGKPASQDAYNCPHCRRMTAAGVINRILGNEFILAMLLLSFLKFFSN